MKRLITILCCAMLISPVPFVRAAQHNPICEQADVPNDANIVGHVVDKKTGEHLPGMTIAIKGTTFGTMTDKTGHYFLKNLRPGKITLIMRGMGYKSMEKEVTVVPKKLVEVNFEAEEDRIHLDEVVVSSNRQTTLRRLAPTLVTVLGDELFEKANAVNLAQGLVFQPGVRVENNCQNCGFNQVRINGLEGRYTQLLIDSRPIMSALSGVYGLEQIPSNMIDRVEVVRGGGSALFGSSAIAGVINIITKEPASNSFSFTESLAFTGMKKPDNNIGFNASIVTDNAKAGAMVFGQARRRMPWDANGDGFSEIGKIDAGSLGAHMYLKTSDYTKISAEIHHINEYRRGGDHLDWPEHVAAVAERTNHSVYSGNLKFDLYSKDYKHHFQAYTSAQLVNRRSYYGSIGEWDDSWGTLDNPVPKDQYGDNYGVTKGKTYNNGLQYTYDFDHFLFLPAQILVGAEYTRDVLNDEMPIRSWEAATGKNGEKYSMFPKLDQRINNWSQLAQIEWKNEYLSFLFGGRLDEHSALKNPIFSPRVTVRVAPMHELNIRASYAKGFRAPQVFDEDLHVGVVGGEAQKIYNDPNLKPEISHAFNLSFDTYFRPWRGAQANFLVEGFYNRLEDVFTNQEQISQGDGIKRFTRVNGSGAKVYGINLEGKIVYQWVQLQAGFTLAKSVYDEAEEWGLHAQFENGRPVMTPQESFDPNTGKDVVLKQYNVSQTSKNMTRTPNAYGYFTLTINPYKSLTLALTGTYTGRMYVPHAISYGAGAAVSDMGHKPFDVVEDETGETDIRVDELVRSKSFFDLGAKLSYDFKVCKTVDLQLFAGMHNLFDSYQKDFDRGVNRDSGYIYGPNMPRTAYMGFKFKF